MPDEEGILKIRERLPFLTHAPRFCCFARLWWGGAGCDAIAWWETDGGFRLKTMRTGEVMERAEAKVLRNEEISERTFELAAADFSRADLANLSDCLALSHFDCWYGFKEDRDRNALWFFDRGGHHPGLTELQTVFVSAFLELSSVRYRRISSDAISRIGGRGMRWSVARQSR